jgi:hypothetical protein
VMISSCHQVRPVAGSSEVTALGVHTINCLLPPALVTMGELKRAAGDDWTGVSRTHRGAPQKLQSLGREGFQNAGFFPKAIAVGTAKLRPVFRSRNAGKHHDQRYPRKNLHVHVASSTVIFDKGEAFSAFNSSRNLRVALCRTIFLLCRMLRRLGMCSPLWDGKEPLLASLIKRRLYTYAASIE